MHWEASPHYWPIYVKRVESSYADNSLKKQSVHLREHSTKQCVYFNNKLCVERFQSINLEKIKEKFCNLYKSLNSVGIEFPIQSLSHTILTTECELQRDSVNFLGSLSSKSAEKTHQLFLPCLWILIAIFDPSIL